MFYRVDKRIIYYFYQNVNSMLNFKLTHYPTVAFHTVRFSDSAPANAAESEKLPKPSRPPVNTCHVWSSDGEMIRTEYLDFYTGDVS